MAETLNLETCPFCGATAEIAENTEHVVVGCGNAFCIVRPNTRIYTTDQQTLEVVHVPRNGAIEGWNCRVSQREIPVINEEDLAYKIGNALTHTVHFDDDVDIDAIVTGVMDVVKPYLREPKRESQGEIRLTQAEWADKILADFRTENNRTKADEWEAAYAHLFKQLQVACGQKRESRPAEIEAAAPAREIRNRWIRIEDFRGEPNSCPLGWWAGRIDESQPYLDEILLDENGLICGKGGCGADYYTHVMLAGIERPRLPTEDIPCDAPLGVAEEARKTSLEKALAEPIYTFKHKTFIAVLKQPFTEEEERVMREYLDFVAERRNLPKDQPS